MQLGVCCQLDQITAAARAGADYVELAVNGVALPEAPDAAWRENLRRIRDGGLPASAWNCLLPGDLMLAGPAADAARFRRYVAIAAERLAEAGAEIAVFGSGASRSAPEGFARDAVTAQFAEAVALVADAFAPAGITIGVEPLRRAETNVLNTVTEAAPLVEGLACPNAKLTADMYHMMENGEVFDLDGIGHLIGHAHVADTARVPPGQGAADFASFFQALARVRYPGRVSIECRWTSFADEVSPALAALRNSLPIGR